jgi:16S rRNA A1518/A1519 N6-dimethyltransferase RsmA/KsgA/DIM1 with predicted DNA glycosylase/AP lyase activity
MVAGYYLVSIAAADTLARPQQKKLELIIGDFVKADLPYFDVCISNTPYQVSGRSVWNSGKRGTHHTSA